ncbi:MAG: hypothetical protein RLZZ338_4558 [Cyanobacteriota bacterium]
MGSGRIALMANPDILGNWFRGGDGFRPYRALLPTRISLVIGSGGVMGSGRIGFDEELILMTVSCDIDLEDKVLTG